MTTTLSRIVMFVLIALVASASWAQGPVGLVKWEITRFETDDVVSSGRITLYPKEIHTRTPADFQREDEERRERSEANTREIEEEFPALARARREHPAPAAHREPAGRR